MGSRAFAIDLPNMKGRVRLINMKTILFKKEKKETPLSWVFCAARNPVSLKPLTSLF